MDNKNISTVKISEPELYGQRIIVKRTSTPWSRSFRRVNVQATQIAIGIDIR